MNIYTALLHYAKDVTYINKYIELCNKHIHKDSIFENHHILPRALFPEFVNFTKNPWNCAKLLPEDHLIAHWYLYKIIGNKEVTHAFRMMVEMKRGLNNLSYDEILKISEDYKLAKEKSNKFQSDIMSNKVSITDGNIYYLIECDEAIPAGFTLGRIPAFVRGSKCWVRNENTNILIPINLKDEYISNGYVQGCLSKRTYTNGITNISVFENELPPTGFYIGCCKVKQNSGNGGTKRGATSKKKNKKYYTNDLGNVLFCYPVDAPEDYYLGGASKKNNNQWLPYISTIKYKKYHDINTKENYSLPEMLSVPSTFVSGYYKRNKNTAKNKIWCYNRLTNKTKMVMLDKIPDGYVIGRGNVIRKSKK